MTQPKIRIVFIGCVLSSEAALRTLLGMESFEVICLVTKRRSQFNADFLDLTNLCNEKQTTVIYADNDWNADTLQTIRAMEPDFIFCVGWSHILPIDLIQIPSKGTIGYHPAKLPQNRGRHPIIWALALGLDETASSFFFIDQKIDNGPLINQHAITITEKDNASSLYKKLIQVIPSQIEKIGEQIVSDALPAEFQDISKANYWRKRGREDGIIDWRMSAKTIHNLIRALSRPYIGAEFRVTSKFVKVWTSKVLIDSRRNIVPGTVLAVSQDGVEVKCGENSILLIELDEVLNINAGDYL